MEKYFAQLKARAICADGSGAAPQWIELLPPGPVLEGRDGRTWVLEDPLTVVQAFDADGKPLPMDYEHATEHKGPLGEPAPAVAWIAELEVRTEGSVWGRVEWNEEGRRAVESRQYRFISPVFDYTADGRHVVRLTSVGLTNMPNLRLAALNRNDRTPDDNGAGNMEDGMLKAICHALGLKEDATEQEVLAAITTQKTEVETAKNRAENPDLTRFVPRLEYDQMQERATNAEKKLKEREQTELNANIAKEVDAAVEAGKIAPASKDYFTSMCRTQGGLEAFRDFVKSAPEVVKGSGLDDETPHSAATLSDEERAACRLMGVSTEEFVKIKEDNN